ncbi:hypothetical protein GCM10009785_21820 [Brooklawnia cerclae]|uniref:Crossover junction endodeoxyribonuclease RusA n=1 Tax=Brooklawnia cerclae TaxID=349934 RepID=A0ABX0SHD5_9ACTN|nr:hypothetical protein [Brooklawnia cerclae]NIH57299.1 crossover junction endodeoxyribonuclease RusA [Brooklawnia cerclae]
MTQTFTLDIPRAWWLSSNQRIHWATRARRTATLRQLAWAQAKAQRIRPADGRVRITATIHSKTGGRFDPANAYPTIKALVDGLTDAGVLVDDSSRYVVGPDMRAGEAMRELAAGWHRVVLTIEPWEEA